jgi:hypothetical protein
MTKFSFRRIVVIYGGLALLSFIFRYLGGEPIGRSIIGIFTSWASATFLAIVYEYSRVLQVPPRTSRIYRYLFIIPGFIQIAEEVNRLIEIRGEVLSNQPYVIYLILYVFWIGFVLLIALLLRSAYITQAVRPTSPVMASEVLAPSSNGASSITNTPSLLLGRGDSHVDRVIHSVIERSMKSERVASFSLTIMLILVMIGGMASFGLWIFTHADRINSLEAERNKLVSLQAEMKIVRDKLGLGSDEAKARLDPFINFVDKNYSTSPSYEATLNRLSLQTQSNYADIAIRVTIALLTIFLVQVFFAVYKYNRHLANILAAKAEAFELAGSEEDARKELCREAASMIKEGVPGFGQPPRTLIEEAVRAAERLRKRE